MGQHYFTENPDTAHKIQEFETILRGKKYIFVTDTGVFSRNRVDRGSELMIEAMEIKPEDKVLDMGCGYGPIGIVAAQLAYAGEVLMIDINQRAVNLAKENLQRNKIYNARVIQNNGFDDLTEYNFDVILMNPPIRAGKKVVYPLIEKVKEHLKIGGSFYTVCRTRQGANSLAKKIEDVFGNILEVEKGSGFRVYRAIKSQSE